MEGITITIGAVDAIARQIQKRGIPNTSLRLGIKGGGCSGFSYVIEFHDGEPRAQDVIIEHTATDGFPVRVLVDPKSLLYMDGMTLDWEKTLMRQGFKFINPHVDKSCGCGESFSVK